LIVAASNAKPKLKRFRLKSGIHRQGGKNYKKDSIIKSEKDLDKGPFKDKFERVADSKEPATPLPLKKKKKKRADE
jgi:hypothetical protein